MKDLSLPEVLAPLTRESLYVGIDVGKQHHVAGFVSTTLLKRHERFEACPVLVFPNLREGFRLLIDRMRDFVCLEQCYVLLEKTGHYHKALIDYFLELDISVYLLHVQKRPCNMLKTDKRDALGLANHLYNQIEKGIQVADRTQLVRRALPPSDAAAQLKGLIGHRHEIVHECTRRKNKLVALCDQILTQVLVNPNSPTALKLRQQFPTPQAFTAASLDAVCAVKGPKRPSRNDMARLQDMASHSIGVKNSERRDELVFEQEQLIQELYLLQQHLAQIDERMTRILGQSREGRILLSLPSMGVFSAAAILAAIGTINNFPNAASLKSYFGWAPRVTQSGTTVDSIKLTRSGERTMKEVMYLLTLRSVREQGPWAELYQRLVERKCEYDEKRRAYRGKMKVVGRIAGQITAMMYALLKADAELLARTPVGVAPAEPMVYDAALHQAHRKGHYRSTKPTVRSEPIMWLAPSGDPTTGVQEAAGFGGA